MTHPVLRRQMNRLTRLEEEVVSAAPPLRVGLNGSDLG